MADPLPVIITPTPEPVVPKEDWFCWAALPCTVWLAYTGHSIEGVVTLAALHKGISAWANKDK
jgi:hypothetical protein